MSKIFYPINEIFYSIQGEAFFAGTPAIFIRLQGCDVGCGFCDTKNSWSLAESNRCHIDDIINKTTSENNTFAIFTSNQIIDAVARFPQCRHVVITGGEPALYALCELIDLLEQQQYQVQLETSGTAEVSVSANTWVTLSPKINMPSKKPLIDTMISRANEIKMPVGKDKDIKTLQSFLESYTLNTKLIWLQPLSCQTKATNLCISAALLHNWRISLQLHKFINIR